MRERAINMHETEVRAILAGRKTQFRRIIQPQPFKSPVRTYKWKWLPTKNNTPSVSWNGNVSIPCPCPQCSLWTRFCPFGTVGDRLWVRETWTRDHEAFYPHFPIVYRADRGYDYERNERGEVYSPEQKAWYPYRWRSSMHMSRWASRITLEVSGLRVERLQDISEKDAIAEGIESRQKAYGSGISWKYYGWLEKHDQWSASPIHSFESLWQSINKPESWAANPWVWVVEFKVV